MYRLMYDIFRFNVRARALVYQWRDQSEEDNDEYWDDLSIGQYLQREGYSDSFSDNYFIVSSTNISILVRSDLILVLFNSQ